MLQAEIDRLKQTNGRLAKKLGQRAPAAPQVCCDRAASVHPKAVTCMQAREAKAQPTTCQDYDNEIKAADHAGHEISFPFAGDLTTGVREGTKVLVTGVRGHVGRAVARACRV